MMIYLDGSATSYPKPASVANAAANAVRRYGFNSGRGGYAASIKAAEMVYSVREKLGAMFGFPAQNIAFTKNCTEALNIAIRGSAVNGGHIIISSLEHNSVYRTVHRLKQEGICDYNIAAFDYDIDTCVSNFKSLIQPNTNMIVCTAASNVFGCVLPISKIGALARENGIRFIADAAQTAGVLPINSMSDNIDILCCAGHKSLMGLMGTGFIAVADGVMLNPFMLGGTGSSSLSADMPDYLPDMLEAGTLNNIGIASLGAGVDYISSRGMDNIYSHEMELCRFVYSQLAKIPDCILYIPMPEKYAFAPIVSFNFGDYSSEKTAALLADKNIAVRAGYHCAPLAHRHFGTEDRGTVRISPTAFSTKKECEYLINTLKKI